MIRSLLGVVDLARDATLAVGAYVGILREHVKGEWATVLGGSFDDRVAQARARMEAQADMLADKEAEEEVAEPAECRCPSCLDVLQAEEESASGAYLEEVGATISDEYRPVYEARLQASVAACQRTEEVGAPQPPVGATTIPKRLTEESLRRIFREETDRAIGQAIELLEQILQLYPLSSGLLNFKPK